MKKIFSYSVRLTIIIMLLVITKTTPREFTTLVENDNINKTIDLTTMAIKVVEDSTINKYTVKDSFTGDLTGYAYNCPLCNGKLSCTPDYNIKDGTIHYNDIDYGEVAIVAASKNLDCGTIIRFNSKRVSNEPTYAIVLDRGVMGSAIDLLVPSEKYAYDYIGRSTITYDVLRNGW